MAKQISYKIIPLCLGVLAVSLLLGYVVFAWTEPSVGPPEGNVSAPINVGTDYQVKDGDLGLRTFYVDDINIGGTIPDLYSAHGNLIVKDISNNITLEIDGSTGNVSLTGDLDVSGGIILGGKKETTWPSGGIGSCADCDSRFINVDGGDTMSGNLDIDAGLTVGDPTGGNKGAGTINAEQIYVGGNELVEMIVAKGSNPNCPSGYEEMNKQWVARTCSCGGLGCPCQPACSPPSCDCTTIVRWIADPPSCGFVCGVANLGSAGNAAGCKRSCNWFTCVANSWSAVLCIKQY